MFHEYILAVLDFHDLFSFTYHVVDHVNLLVQGSQVSIYHLNASPRGGLAALFQLVISIDNLLHNVLHIAYVTSKTYFSLFCFYS